MSRDRRPITQCTASEWRDACRKLRACVPAPDGFLWRFVWCKQLEHLGDCARTVGQHGRLGTFTIRVLRGLSESETTEVLVHELAHAFDRWDHHGWSGDHGDTYWIWYGRIWRRLEGNS